MSEVKTNKISSVSTNGDITLDPDGTGSVAITNSGSSNALEIATHISTYEVQFTGSTHANLTANIGANPFYIQNLGAGTMNFQTSATDRMVIDSSGRITMPNQPAFSVKPASNQTNLSGDTNVTVVMDSEAYDVGANFASNTFTAPVTGKYVLSFILYGSQLAGDTSYMEAAIETSNRTYVNIQEPSGSESVYAGTTVTAVADMDANDTAYCRITVGSSSTFDVANVSIFCGALIC